MTHAKDTKKHLIIDLDQQPNIFDYIQNGITITNKDSTILYTNPSFTRITGYTKEEAQGNNPGVLHSGHHGKDFYETMWKDIEGKGYWEGEIWNRRKTGEIYPEYLTISKIIQDNSNQFFYMAIFSDISYLKEDISKKLHLAFYDPLTELPNRNFYLDHVNKTIEHAKTETGKAKTKVVFYMDLDKFKHVNDTYGHLIGDQLLKMVGKRLGSITRKGDTIARIGGDEFAAIITSDCDKDSIKNLAKRIVISLEEPFLIEDHNINISISIGISFYPNDTVNIETLLSNADQAMYIAKKTGTKIKFFSSPD
ncbi:MAG: sensor domain-containing diguanylate cyclase [Gammaproteobacteria bacterium]|nr:sensor domain-containing diguanylate cyclase [Gammaproteobacteria bacterium]